MTNQVNSLYHGWTPSQTKPNNNPKPPYLIRAVNTMDQKADEYREIQGIPGHTFKQVSRALGAWRQAQQNLRLAYRKFERDHGQELCPECGTPSRTHYIETDESDTDPDTGKEIVNEMRVNYCPQCDSTFAIDKVSHLRE